MSWLAKSIANSLRLDDEDVAAGDAKSTPDRGDDSDSDSDPDSLPPPPQGVKEDLSEITKTLTRQFWGVASFLAPPPAPDSNEPDAADPAGIAGIRSDFAEIGGRFRTGISKLSSHKAVSEITKMASNLLQLGSEEQGSVEKYAASGVVGITDEVVFFARNITMHAGTWLDFPLPDDEDFDLSDVQHEHALAVESLVPRLADLRIELCPGYMSENCFWKIYFVLLHPKLNKKDAELLSTPQIMEARALLQHELLGRNNPMPESELSGSGLSGSKENTDSKEPLSVPANAQFQSAPLTSSKPEVATSTAATEFVTEKHLLQNIEIQVVDKSVIEEGPMDQIKYENSVTGSSRALEEKFEDDGDDWLKEDSLEAVGMGGVSVPVMNEEDVSFSDFEEDDGDAPTTYKKSTNGSDSSTKDSRDWIQLSRSSTDSAADNPKLGGSEHASSRNPEARESNDWLDVEDIDVD